MSEAQGAEALARQLKGLLEGGDFDALEGVLDPDVTWAAPDYPDDGCHNRSEVLAWWRAAYEAGARAEVTGVEVHGDGLLVSLRVSGRAGGSGDRFQALTVGPRGVTSIAGFESHAEALSRLVG